MVTAIKTSVVSFADAASVYSDSNYNLITTDTQCPANAEYKTERIPAPDALMMNIGATPSSNCLKNKTR